MAFCFSPSKFAAARSKLSSNRAERIHQLQLDKSRNHSQPTSRLGQDGTITKLIELEEDLRRRQDAKVERQRLKAQKLQASLSQEQIHMHEKVLAMELEQLSKLVRRSQPKRPMKKPLPWKTYVKPLSDVGSESTVPTLPQTSEVETSEPQFDLESPDAEGISKRYRMIHYWKRRVKPNFTPKRSRQASLSAELNKFTSAPHISPVHRRVLLSDLGA